MSSVPPNTPPGGVPPYDPHTQWRVYREQQRAAWRAQRDAWKAQRHAWKAGVVGAYAPRVPSVVGPLILVGIGIVALLIYTGHIDSGQFWDWYAKWWPLLLIMAGLAMLAEWAIDLRAKAPVRRGGNFVGLLIVLAVVGVVAAWGHSNWDWMRSGFGDNDDFFNMLGRPQHDLDQQVLNTQIPANGVVDIENPRGDVSVTSGDGLNVQVNAHEIAFADNETQAKKIFDAEAAHVTVSGGTVLVKSAGHSSGRVNLTVIVPKSAQMTVNAGHGDVTAAGLGNGATVTAGHGDIHLSAINGSVQVHFSTDKGDFSAHQITGDITADGRCNDLTLSEVKGKITMNGDIFGEAHMENLAGPVHLHTSVTDLQFGELPGDMTLNDDDLRVTESKGPVRVITHSKNVELTQIYGETHVEDRDGNISISPAGNYTVEATSKSGHGDVELTLPPNASVTVDGNTRNGDILTDFPLAISGEEGKTVTGKIGAGTAKVVLSTDVGDLNIKKGSGFPATPPPATADEPAAPAAPNAPHLKAPKTQTEPVAQ
ncbi:MAG TPA: DUF4097 family beta strand repeat-containing protein [Terracidiphilus sp.]|nr:DUF4097 family beta strand repeat-containing protein [Terracidiphilus sp.]